MTELTSLNKFRLLLLLLLLLLLQSLDETEGVALLVVDTLSVFVVEESLLLESSSAGVFLREVFLGSEEDCSVSGGGKLSARDLIDCREVLLSIIELATEGISEEDL